ncbi:DNA-processing protein DprA [Thermoflavimicrobium daqui]|nr:DNA-processing protein DprA [Thermoflavimicrobium daqui]
MERREGLIALRQIKGIGWHTIDKMLKMDWSPDQELTTELLDFLSTSKISKKSIEFLRGNWSPTFIRQVNEELKQRKIITQTLWDEDYPDLLREIAQPPWVLYMKGDPALLTDYLLAVVGTRRPTAYGIKTTRFLCEEIVASGWGVVSGMAYGIDVEAHRTVLKAAGKTIAVLGTGVDVIYPKNHRFIYEELIQHGTVISEMPLGTQPHPGLFPQRNRIISGLCMGTVIVEAAERSGSLITANYSMEQGREVFAIPGQVGNEQSQGTLRLIQQGAKCVTNIEDILEEYPYIPRQYQVKHKGGAEISVWNEKEQKVLQCVTTEPQQITIIIERLKEEMLIGEIHQTLLSLQLKGDIIQLPGSYYVRK